MKSKKAKRTKKAITLLTKIEKLLADVLVECSAFEKTLEKNVRILVRAAEKSIGDAKDFFAPAPAEVRRKAVKKPVAKRKAAAPAARKRAVKAAKPRKTTVIALREPAAAAIPAPPEISAAAPVV